MTVFYNIVTTEAASDGAGVPRSVHTAEPGEQGVTVFLIGMWFNH